MSKKRATPTDLFGRVTDAAQDGGQSDPPHRVPRTADRGVDAPALHNARDAVRQDALRHGSGDPDSLWTQRRLLLNPRSRTEHLAIGSGAQNEMFGFTPGTRAVDPKSPEAAPYTEYYDHWRKRRDVDASERDYFAKGYARAQKVMSTKADDGSTRTSVTVAGYVFEADGNGLYDSLDSLAYTVRGGPAKATRAATPEPSALDLIAQARARMPEAERARRDAYSHFMTRRIALGRARDKGFSLTVSEGDRKHAATLGVTAPDEEHVSDMLTIATFLGACADKTRDLEDAAWFGLTRDLLPGEAMERTTAQVQRVERYQNDRYIDHSGRPTATPDARVGDAAAGRDSLLERSAVLEPGADPLDEISETHNSGHTA